MTLTMATATIGSGPKVVLVGDELTGWQSWAPLVERLAVDHTVMRVQPLAVQLAGKDWPLPADYSVELESKALAGALDDTPVDVIAWAYGGLIALDYALDRPKRIRSLTLIEPHAFWVLSATNRMDEESREQIRALRESTTSKRTKSARWDHVGSLQRLEAFPHPLLLVKGASSSHYLHRIVDALAFSVTRSEVIELPGGHAAHLDSADAFTGALTRFLANARA